LAIHAHRPAAARKLMAYGQEELVQWRRSTWNQGCVGGVLVWRYRDQWRWVYLGLGKALSVRTVCWSDPRISVRAPTCTRRIGHRRDIGPLAGSIHGVFIRCTWSLDLDSTGLLAALVTSAVSQKNLLKRMSGISGSSFQNSFW